MHSEPNRKTNNLLLILFLIISAFMLFFGIRQKGYPLENGLYINQEQGYAEFSAPSMALYKIDQAVKKNPGEKLVIELVIEPYIPEKISFNFILHLHAEAPEKDLVIAQWDRALVIMNGNDYSNSRRQPKIYAALPDSRAPLYITLVSDGKGTAVYYNGEETFLSRKLNLTLPEEPRTPLILGNNIHGQHSWSGKIYGCALFYTDADDTLVEERVLFRDKNGTLAPLPERQGGIRIDFAESLPEELIITENVRSLERRVLAWPRHLRSTYSTSLKTDIIVNLLGFIPFGFLLMLILYQAKRPCRLGIVLGTSAGFSLVLEIIQVWIPFRDSSLLDLCLNSAGGLTGGLIVLLFHSILSSRPTHE